MKASYLAAVAVALGIAVALLAYPAFASSPNGTSASTSSSSTSMGHPGHGILQRVANFLKARAGRLGVSGQAVNFSTGQAITVTSTTGKFAVAGTQGKSNGTASGTLVFTVNGKLTSGYVIGVTGSFTVNGTTYQVASGSGEMGPFGTTILASGTTTSSGTFLLRATAHGDFSGTSQASVGVDFSSGTTEYLVSLTGSISG